jgi:hypothetical protein
MRSSRTLGAGPWRVAGPAKALTAGLLPALVAGVAAAIIAGLVVRVPGWARLAGASGAALGAPGGRMVTA